MQNIRKPTLLALLATGLFLNGCNVTGGIDSPSGREENLSSAKIKLDAGDCQAALDAVNSIANPNNEVKLGNDVKQVKGWIQLCLAGAKINTVGKTLFAYSSSSNNLNVIGDLANALVPSTDTTILQIQNAAATFDSIVANDTPTVNERAVNKAFANLIKASAILAKASGDITKIRRSDVGATTCLNADCATLPAACGSRNMSDTDASNFSDALTNAGNAVAGIDGIGTAKSLAETLAGKTGAANLVRCFIYNQMLSN